MLPEVARAAGAFLVGRGHPCEPQWRCSVRPAHQSATSASAMACQSDWRARCGSGGITLVR